MLADRPNAVAAVTRIFLAEIERLLCAAAGVTSDAPAPAVRPRLGAVSFLHRFGSALNHHVHLHVCATDGVFMPAANGAGCDAPPAFLPVRPITQIHLAALTERVRRRVIRWFRLAHLLDASAAATMLAWENSGFSIDASVRIALFRLQLRVYCQPLEHLLRYCARPPFALERLSVIRDASGRITRVRYSLPRHKAANWVGPGRGRTSTRPGANGVVELLPFEFLDRLADLVPPPRKHRHRYHGVFAPNHRLRKAVTLLAIGNIGKRRDAATGGQAACGAVGGHAVEGCCDTHEPPLVSTARGPPTDWGELVQVHDERDIFQASPQELPAIDIHSRRPASEARRRSPGNGRLGRGLRRREKNANKAGAGRFEKPTPDARARSSRDSRVAHQPEDRCRSAIDRASLWPSTCGTFERPDRLAPAVFE
jgi:hypothetical protein